MMVQNNPRIFHWTLAGLLACLFVLALGIFTYANYLTGATPPMLLGSILILSIPLGALFFSVGLLGWAWEQKRRLGLIGGRLRGVLCWTPRAAGILIAIFVGLFALDVFDLLGSSNVWQILGAFIIHSLPAFAMAALLVLAWRWPWIGCLAFLAAGIYFMLRFGMQPDSAFGIFLLFTGPMLAIALLFGANWWWRKDLNEHQK